MDSLTGILITLSRPRSGSVKPADEVLAGVYFIIEFTPANGELWCIEVNYMMTLWIYCRKLFIFLIIRNLWIYSSAKVIARLIHFYPDLTYNYSNINLTSMHISCSCCNDSDTLIFTCVKKMLWTLFAMSIKYTELRK